MATPAAAPSEASGSAGPSSGPSSAPHQAFPTAAAYGGNAEPAPQPHEALWPLITSCTTHGEIRSRLLPVLQKLVQGAKKDTLARASLALAEVDIYGLPDQQVDRFTLGLVCVVHERLLHPVKDADPGLIMGFADRLMRSADPGHLAMAPPLEMAWLFLRAAQRDNQAALTLAPLSALLRKTARAATFRGVHAVYLEACLLSGDISNARESLTTYMNIHEGTSYRDVLTYYYHAGTVEAISEDYARATALFTFGAAVPARTASAIQVACARRAILCELLNTGRQVEWPKDMSGPMSRAMEKGFELYTKLATAFASGNWDAARQTATGGRSVFQRDCNWGLVERVLASITKQSILKLRQTYSRLPLATLADKVQASEGQVRESLDAMVSRGDIRASVSQSIVTFEEEEDPASADNMARLRHAQRMADWVNLDLDEANRHMSLNPKWLTKQVHAVLNKEKGSEAIKSRGDDEDGGVAVGAVRGAGGDLDDLGF